MDTVVAETGKKERTPRVSIRFSLSAERENDQTDAWRDSQNFSARPKSQGRTGMAYRFVFPVQLTPSKIGN